MRGPAGTDAFPWWCYGIIARPPLASVHWCDGNAGLPVIQITVIARHQSLSHPAFSMSCRLHTAKFQMRGRMRRMETCEKHAQPFIVLGHDTAFLNGENEPKLTLMRDLGIRMMVAQGPEEGKQGKMRITHLCSIAHGQDAFVWLANDTVRWQFASSGDHGLPHLASTQEKRNFLTFAKAMSQMKQRRQDLLHRRHLQRKSEGF